MESTPNKFKIWACYECDQNCIILNFNEKNTFCCPSTYFRSSNWFEYEYSDMLISELIKSVDLVEVV